MFLAIYKQYHYSPKQWQELKTVAMAVEEKVVKPTNLGGTRWLPHVQRGLQTLLQNYKAVVMHLENGVEGWVGTAEMQGRARSIVRSLKSYMGLLFIHLVLNILECLAS